MEFQFNIYIISEYRMETVEILKIALMIAFFAEVVIFGKFISNLKCFK